MQARIIDCGEWTLVRVPAGLLDVHQQAEFNNKCRGLPRYRSAFSLKAVLVRSDGADVLRAALASFGCPVVELTA